MILNELANSVTILLALIKANMFFSLMVLAALWTIHLLNWCLKGYLNRFGIYPRHPYGLIGVIFSPFLHAHFDHLFFNSIPLFILLSLLPVYGKLVLIKTTLFIIVTSGLLTWLFGRKAFHIGASSLIMGYWSFLITKAYEAPSMMSVLLAFLTLYYLGSMILNLFPQSEKTSWEGHLFGFIAGIAAAFLW
jgi:membrane associated rhomboid family serine protease